MKRAQVIEVTTRSFPDMGGVEHHVHQLSRAMIQRGIRVSVYSHAGSSPEQGYAEREVIDGVEYNRFRLPFSRNWSIPSLKLLAALRQRARTADAIHLHLYHQPLAVVAAIALTGSKTPIILTPHYHGTGHSRLARLLHRIWQPTAGRFLMSAAFHVIAVSEPEANLLVRHFPFLEGRITVIPNGITPLRPASPSPVDASMHVVLGVGRLESYKGNDLIIRSMAELGEQYLLVLVGDGPERSKLQQLAAMLGVEHRVLFTGRVDDDSLAAWFARADVFVSMSEQEAFGLALGEALAAGVPAVVSDIPAFRYVAGLAEQEGAPPGAVTFTDDAGLSEALANAPSRIRPILVSRWEEAADKTIEVLFSAK